MSKINFPRQPGCSDPAVAVRQTLGIFSLCAATFAPLSSEVLAASKSEQGAMCVTPARINQIHLRQGFKLSQATLDLRRAKGLNGNAVSLRDLIGQKEALVVMVALDVGCPRSFEGAKQMALLAKEPSLKGDVAFAFVVKGTTGDLTKYPAQVRGVLQVASEPTAFSAQSLGLDRAAQIALITKDGTVLATYQGYSREVFEDIARLVARNAGRTPLPLQSGSKYVDGEPHNGCPFFAKK